MSSGTPRAERLKRRRAIGAVPVLQRLRLDHSLVRVMAGLYALLAVFIGFAHGPLGLGSANGATVAQQARYERVVLPDGSVAEICAANDTLGSAHHMAAGHGCDACRITSAPGLETAAELGLGRADVTLRAVKAPEPAAIYGQFLAEPTARGPPKPVSVA